MRRKVEQAGPPNAGAVTSAGARWVLGRCPDHAAEGASPGALDGPRGVEKIWTGSTIHPVLTGWPEHGTFQRQTCAGELPAGAGCRFPAAGGARGRGAGGADVLGTLVRRGVRFAWDGGWPTSGALRCAASSTSRCAAWWRPSTSPNPAREALDLALGWGWQLGAGDAPSVGPALDVPCLERLRASARAVPSGGRMRVAGCRGRRELLERLRRKTPRELNGSERISVHDPSSFARQPHASRRATMSLVSPRGRDPSGTSTGI
jgi:hypothetical protein